MVRLWPSFPDPAGCISRPAWGRSYRWRTAFTRNGRTVGSSSRSHLSFPENSLRDAAANPFSLGLAASKAEIRGDYLVTELGAPVELVWGDPYRVIAECDLALSLPGTNTAELAIAGKPAVIPLSYRVPVGGGGLLGLLDRVLGFGFLKRYLKEHKYQRLKLLALPNQLAGRMIMPEFFVRDDLSDLFDFLSRLLDDPNERRRIGEEARTVMGPTGAAERFVDLLEMAVGRG